MSIEAWRRHFAGWAPIDRFVPVDNGHVSSARFVLVAQQFLQLNLEITATVVAAIGDQAQRGSRLADVENGRHAKKGSQIAGILWASDIVSSQDLQGDQVSYGRDANHQSREQFDFVGSRHNLLLDS